MPPTELDACRSARANVESRGENADDHVATGHAPADGAQCRHQRIPFPARVQASRVSDHERLVRRSHAGRRDPLRRRKAMDHWDARRPVTTLIYLLHLGRCDGTPLRSPHGGVELLEDAIERGAVDAPVVGKEVVRRIPHRREHRQPRPFGERRRDIDHRRPRERNPEHVRLHAGGELRHLGDQSRQVPPRDVAVEEAPGRALDATSPAVEAPLGHDVERRSRSVRERFRPWAAAYPGENREREAVRGIHEAEVAEVHATDALWHWRDGGHDENAWRVGSRRRARAVGCSWCRNGGHAAGSLSRTFTTVSLTAGARYSGGTVQLRSRRSAARTATAMRAGSTPAMTLLPHSTVSGRSVTSRVVTFATRRMQHSS